MVLKRFQIVAVLTLFMMSFLSVRTEWDSSSNSEHIESTKPVNETKPLRIAFCLNGQLARLELYSKIKNIFIPNARIGNLVHVFIYLDNEVEHVKQTYWNYDYSKAMYGGHSKKELKAVVDDAATQSGFKTRIRTRVLLQPPPRHVFAIAHEGEVPVKDKPFTGHDGPHDLFESAASRFQNNMRWMAGLRECARWVMAAELDQKWFYDVVVRLREDTFAFGPWLLSPPGLYRGALSSMSMGNFGGVNDHNFVIDRLWLDDLYRGLTEDYYFNSTLEHEPWGNPEHHIYQLAEAYNIPLRSMGVCEQPLIPLRGLVNESYWYVHPLYVRQLREACWPKLFVDDINDKDEEDDNDDDDDDTEDQDSGASGESGGKDDKKDKGAGHRSLRTTASVDQAEGRGGGESRSVVSTLRRFVGSVVGKVFGSSRSTGAMAATGGGDGDSNNHSNSVDVDRESRKAASKKKDKEKDKEKDKGRTYQPTFQPRVVPSCCPPIWQDIVHYKAVKTSSFSSFASADDQV